MATRGTTNEGSRLRSKETDWKLPGDGNTATRTRGGGKRKERPIHPPSSSSSDEEWEYEGDEEEDEDDEEEMMLLQRKPLHQRVILEVKHVEEALVKFSKCPECGGVLHVTLNTICITTSIIMSCKNSDCEFVTFKPRGQCAQTSIHETDNFERMTDYALNVLYVLGFISMGDAHTEAGRLLGLCGLPNDTTMKGRSFGMIEERIGPFIRQLGEEIIINNLIEEARLSMEVDNNSEYFPTWKASLTDDTIVLDPDKLPRIDASYDMAWQQKGSGHQYNSMSGHGSMFGSITRRIIGLVIKSKLCNKCNVSRKNNPALAYGDHDGPCWKNHNGTSGSMESAGCLQLVVDIFDKHHAIIRRLCCDDDSSIRADCQWSNADYLTNNNTTVLPLVPKRVGANKGKMQTRPDKGKLPAHVPQPKFVADPNHRRKGLTGELIKLDKSRAEIKQTMTRMDSTRIGKNFAYMARTLKDRPSHEFVDAAKAVLEHHFDNHLYCGDWCKRKDETVEQRQRIIKYYRSKEKDAKLYNLLSKTIERFITIDKLVEMAHGMDTNVNEAFNQICTWFAPKNKVFAGSGSLHNRIHFAVGINSVGYNQFFTNLFDKLGIAVTDNVAHYLLIKENTRLKRLAKIKTKEAKLSKNQSKRNKLQADTRVAKTEFLRREGTYKKGMNVDDPYGELPTGADNDDEVDARKPAARRRATAVKNSTKLYCEYCGIRGHATQKHSKCTAAKNSTKIYKRDDGSLLPLQETLAAAATADDDSDDGFLMPTGLLDENHLIDCHENDLIPLDTEVQDDGDSSDLDIFHDAHTWDNDDEDTATDKRRPLETGEL
jgi:hypothetical protein